MADVTEGQKYTLTIGRGGSIRISRGLEDGSEAAQEVTHESLHRHGWNSIADAARLIERKLAGEFGSGG